MQKGQQEKVDVTYLEKHKELFQKITIMAFALMLQVRIGMEHEKARLRTESKIVSAATNDGQPHEAMRSKRKLLDKRRLIQKELRSMSGNDSLMDYVRDPLGHDPAHEGAHPQGPLAPHRGVQVDKHLPKRKAQQPSTSTDAKSDGVDKFHQRKMTRLQKQIDKYFDLHAPVYETVMEQRKQKLQREGSNHY